MKPFLFEVMKEIIGDAKCSFIGEIGTHRGGTAKQLIQHFSHNVEQIKYEGYDVFDADNPDKNMHKRERNGKAPVNLYVAARTLDKCKKKYKNLEYTLHKGYTTDTLVSPVVFDFVWIDGGHSYETVKHDYSMVKDSKLIIFDDFKIKGVNTFIKELIAEGVDVEIVRTESKHIWAIIRN